VATARKLAIYGCTGCFVRKHLIHRFFHRG
jgi:hypothetical protein